MESRFTRPSPRILKHFKLTRSGVGFLKAPPKIRDGDFIRPSWRSGAELEPYGSGTAASRDDVAALEPERGCYVRCKHTSNVGACCLPRGNLAGVDRMAKDDVEKATAFARCSIPPIELSERQACDVELLCTGAFSPLEGFMNEDVWC